MRGCSLFHSCCFLLQPSISPHSAAGVIYFTHMSYLFILWDSKPAVKHQSDLDNLHTPTAYNQNVNLHIVLHMKFYITSFLFLRFSFSSFESDTLTWSLQSWITNWSRFSMAAWASRKEAMITNLFKWSNQPTKVLVLLNM